jgi:ATP-dependent helicase HrpA
MVPIALLNRVPDHLFEWLVPGLLREKCIALLKALPKHRRKQFVPIPEAVDRILAHLSPSDRPLHEALADALLSIQRERIPTDEWQLDQLEDFYRANFRVLDSNGELLAQSRDLAALKRELQAPMQQSLQQQVANGFQRDALQRWDFGSLPQTYRFEQAGQTITAYPALIDEHDSVAIRLVESPALAQQKTEQGVIRLLQLQSVPTTKYLRKELLRGNTLNLQLAGIDQRREVWVEDVITASYHEAFITGHELPRDQAEFDRRLQLGINSVTAIAQRYATVLQTIAETYAQIRQQRRQGGELAWLPVLEDIDQQLALLFKPHFIVDTPWQWLQHYPRYLQAIVQRLQKLRGFFQRDRDLSRELLPLQKQLQDFLQRQPDAINHCEPLQHYRWLLEELRVSLFAQTLGTIEPASVKRLRDLWGQAREQCR